MSSSSTIKSRTRGGMAFAAIMMMLIGLFHAIVGVATLLADQIIVSIANYAFTVGMTAWGIAHLILGGVAFLAGLFLFTGMMAARAIGVVVAAISLLACFLFLPYSPIWALIIMVMDVVAIWALTTATMQAGVETSESEASGTRTRTDSESRGQLSERGRRSEPVGRSEKTPSGHVMADSQAGGGRGSIEPNPKMGSYESEKSSESSSSSISPKQHPPVDH